MGYVIMREEEKEIDHSLKTILFLLAEFILPVSSSGFKLDL